MSEGDPTEIASRLRAAGSVFAEDEAELLRAASHGDRDLEAMVQRRIVGEPIEHIVGWAEFCGLRIVVGPGVFVPRRRTEHLVDEAVKLLTAGAIVVDLCCGSGAVAVAIAATTPGLRVHAADIDPVAVACARLNLEPLGGTVHEGDLFAALPAALRGHIGLLVVNAPYVPTAAIEMMPREARLHEPLSTLDGGADGLDIQRGVAHGAPEWLAAAGHIVIETSADQSAVTRSIFEDAGLSARIVSSHDLDATVVICTSSQD